MNTDQPLFVYNKTFLAAEESAALMSLFGDSNFIEYKTRGSFLKARPKTEYRKSEGINYRWGQQSDYYNMGTTSFPPIMEQLVEKIGDPSINHIIATRYLIGNEHHIPWHHDKQEGAPGRGAKDIKADTNIYNVVVCDNPRRFQLAYPDKIFKEGKRKGDAAEYVFDEDLTNGSMMTLTAEGNKTLKHRVPKDKSWRGVRYSIVLRTLKTPEEKQKKTKRTKRQRVV